MLYTIVYMVMIVKFHILVFIFISDIIMSNPLQNVPNSSKSLSISFLRAMKLDKVQKREHPQRAKPKISVELPLTCCWEVCFTSVVKRYIQTSLSFRCRVIS